MHFYSVTKYSGIITARFSTNSTGGNHEHGQHGRSSNDSTAHRRPWSYKERAIPENYRRGGATGRGFRRGKNRRPCRVPGLRIHELASRTLSLARRRYHSQQPDERYVDNNQRQDRQPTTPAAGSVPMPRAGCTWIPAGTVAGIPYRKNTANSGSTRTTCNRSPASIFS